MALGADDLLAPKGEIEAGLLPAERLEERLEEYLAQGYKRCATAGLGANDPRLDDAVLAWSYHRTYHAAYLRMSAAPIQGGLDGQIAQTFDIEQAQRFAALSTTKLREFQALTTPSGEVSEPSGTKGVRTAVGW